MNEQEFLAHEIVTVVLKKKDNFKDIFEEKGQPDIYKMPLVNYGDKKPDLTREFVRHNLQIQTIAQQETKQGDFIKDKLYPLSKAVLNDFDGYDIYYCLGGTTVEEFVDDVHEWAVKEYDKMENYNKQ